MKPWHVKATYQLYDEKGKPTVQGTYEYWWASPKVYRSTWIRPGTVHTDWHTADGKHAYLETGERLNYFEYKLQAALLSPLPDEKDLAPGASQLEREEKKLGTVKLPCVMLIPPESKDARANSAIPSSPPLGLYPTYCFDPEVPALRVHSSMGSLTVGFNRIAKFQGRFMAFDISFFENRQMILTAKVDQLGGLQPDDAAFAPTAEGVEAMIDKVPIAAGVAVGLLIKKQPPFYPQDAKDARASGTVVLRATIGRDGAIHDLKVVSAPWPSLAASALWAVSHWEYKPYMLNGEPVEVDTTINVIFTLG